MGYKKVCVEVLAIFSREGGVRPVVLIRQDGRRYPIDRVRTVGHAPARVAAVLPVRFACSVCGREVALYFEPARLRWFIELSV